MKSLKELEQEYKRKQRLWKLSIRLDTNKFRRFWKWVLYFIASPFVCLSYKVKNYKNKERIKRAMEQKCPYLIEKEK